MKRANHRDNRRHKRELASARRGISKAYNALFDVQYDLLNDEAEISESLQECSTSLLTANRLIADFAKKRYNIDAETLDRY